VQVALAFKVTVPVVQPEPDQPAKVEPAAGMAVKVTELPLLKVAEQMLPQLIPVGLLVTVPFPVPLLVTALTTFTESVNCWGELLNVAVQVKLALMATVPVVQPEPDQPAKVEPAAGMAVKVTELPLLKVAEQMLPQLMPVGLLVTVPDPVPLFAIASVNVCGVEAHDSFEGAELPVELKAEIR
jgi:hypothetical protein